MGHKCLFSPAFWIVFYVRQLEILYDAEAFRKDKMKSSTQKFRSVFPLYAIKWALRLKRKAIHDLFTELDQYLLNSQAMSFWVQN